LEVKKLFAAKKEVLSTPEVRENLKSATLPLYQRVEDRAPSQHNIYIK
jgi:hypothetical protein